MSDSPAINLQGCDRKTAGGHPFLSGNLPIIAAGRRVSFRSGIHLPQATLALRRGRIGGGSAGESPDGGDWFPRSFIEDGGTRLKQLLARLGMGTGRFSKVHPAEFSAEFLETFGFHPSGGYPLYTAKARSHQGRSV